MTKLWCAILNLLFKMTEEEKIARGCCQAPAPEPEPSTDKILAAMRERRALAQPPQPAHDFAMPTATVGLQPSIPVGLVAVGGVMMTVATAEELRRRQAAEEEEEARRRRRQAAEEEEARRRTYDTAIPDVFHTPYGPDTSVLSTTVPEYQAPDVCVDTPEAKCPAPEPSYTPSPVYEAPAPSYDPSPSYSDSSSSSSSSDSSSWSSDSSSSSFSSD